MVDEYSAACERKPATEIIVERYHHDTPGSRDGITRQGGVVANGVPNPRAREQATFRGKELMSRKADTR
jgi:hypothetical protein